MAMDLVLGKVQEASDARTPYAAEESYRERQKASETEQ